MGEKLSVLIPTFNEAENIADCIRSIGDLADELLVMDSFSTDRTVEIARSLHADVQQRAFDNYSKNKNAALDQLSHNWVLVLDADERLSEPLRQEIREVLAGPTCDAYRIDRETFFKSRRVRCWSSGSVLRLFRRDKAHFREDRLVHEELIIQGSVGHLKSPMLHYTFRSFSQYLPKMHSFAELAARQAHQEGRRASRTGLLLHPPVRFLKTYLLRGGIWDGIPGLLIAWLSAYSIYLKYARLWELQKDAER